METDLLHGDLAETDALWGAIFTLAKSNVPTIAADPGVSSIDSRT